MVIYQCKLHFSLSRLLLELPKLIWTFGNIVLLETWDTWISLFVYALRRSWTVIYFMLTYNELFGTGSVAQNCGNICIFICIVQLPYKIGNLHLCHWIMAFETARISTHITPYYIVRA
jgi:hypothetical protein